MNTLKSLLKVLVFLVLSFSFMSLIMPKNGGFLELKLIDQDTSKWVAPASANDLINPYEVNAENIAAGLLVYKKNCRSCHGRKGDGHGAGAIGMSPGDFTNPSFVDQTDGSIFWKISEGRTDMDPYNKTLEEEQIWFVVMYIKTFAQVSEK